MVSATTTLQPAIPAAKRLWRLETDQWLPISLSSVYCALEVNNLIHHSLWRDELQSWVIARSSHTIVELLYAKRYEGHPDLWFLILYFVTRFTANPVAMQFVHLLLSVAAVYVVARFAPFSRLQKILFTFGYFPFFEYATISRNYGIGMLLVFCFCALYHAGPEKNILALSLVLSLLAQTSVYSFIIAVALSLIILWNMVWPSSNQGPAFPKLGETLLSAAIFTGALCISFVHLRPPADGGIHFTRISPLYTLTMVWRGFVPIPKITHHFWNTNVMHTPEMAALSVVVLLISLSFFLRRPAVLVAYCSGMAGLFLFKQFMHFGELRHDGEAFVLFLGCVWLASCYSGKRHLSNEHLLNKFSKKPLEWLEVHQGAALTGVLGLQVIAGVIASALALSSPFSRGKDVAQYLSDRHMDKMFIVGDDDFSASTVAGYMNRDIFYRSGNRMGSYIIWDDRRRVHPVETAVELAEQKALEQRQDVLALLSYPLTSPDPAVVKLASFEGAIQVDENYYLYLIKYAIPVQ